MDREIIETKTKGLGKKVKEATYRRILEKITPDAAKAEKLSKHKQDQRDQLNGGNQKTIKSCTTRYQIGSENLPIFEEKCG